MYRALRDHDPLHHVVPEDRSGRKLCADYYVLSRYADTTTTVNGRLVA